jgi:multidrug resistance efflux pump
MVVTFSRTLRAIETDSVRPRVIGLVSAALLLFGWSAWFAYGRVTVYEVTERALLEVTRAAHPVATRVDGRVVRTSLELGKEVKAGEVLVELDAETERLALDEATARLTGLRAQIEALPPQIQAEQEGLDAFRKASAVALDESRARVAEADARARFAEEQVGSRRILRGRRLVSEEEFHQAQAGADSDRATVKALKLVTTKLDQDAAVQTRDREARIAKLKRKLAELEGDASAKEATVARFEHDIELRRIRAAVDGRLGRVERLRIGTVVHTGDVLGAIIPAGPPRAVAFFPVAGVGRIRSGQPARLRLDGFPWTQYGTLSATVASVGSDPEAGRVRVELTLQGESTPAIPLEHGLSGTASTSFSERSGAGSPRSARGHDRSDVPPTPVRPRGHPDLGDGLRTGRAQVPA